MGSDILTFGEESLNSDFFRVVDLRRSSRQRILRHSGLRGVKLRNLAPGETTYSITTEYNVFPNSLFLSNVARLRRHWYDVLAPWDELKAEGNGLSLSLGSVVLADSELGLAFLESVDHHWQYIAQGIGRGAVPRHIPVTLEFVTSAQLVKIQGKPESKRARAITDISGSDFDLDFSSRIGLTGTESPYFVIADNADFSTDFSSRT